MQFAAASVGSVHSAASWWSSALLDHMAHLGIAGACLAGACTVVVAWEGGQSCPHGGLRTEVYRSDLCEHLARPAGWQPRGSSGADSCHARLRFVFGMHDHGSLRFPSPPQHADLVIRFRQRLGLPLLSLRNTGFALYT